MGLEEVVEFIKSTLPSATEDEQSLILDVSKSFGVRDVSDFNDDLVDRKLLLEKLPAVFVNKLYIAALATQQAPRQQTTAHNATRSAENELKRKILSYEINWDLIGYTAQLESESTLNNSIRLDIIRRIISDVVNKFGYRQNPGRDLWKRIAVLMADKYKHHFEEFTDQSTKKGTRTVVTQLENRFHEERGKRHREDAENEDDVPQQLMKRFKKSDLLGCDKTQYAPPLPEGETEESQEELRQSLEQQYNTPYNTWNMDKILQEMNATYPTVRDIIVSGMESPINQLLEKWRFIFHPQVLLQHFDRLTARDSKNLMDNFIRSSLKNLLQYLCTREKIHRQQKQRISYIYFAIESIAPTFSIDMQLLAAFHMIAAHFNEDVSQLIIKYKEPGAGNEDVQNLHNLPGTPIIVIVGDDTCLSVDYRVLIDQIVVSRLTNFKDALMVTFASYFVFRIVYPSRLKSTMEYYQYHIMEIVTGTKSTKEGGGDCPDIRQNVVQLIKDTAEFRRGVEKAASDF